jgi:tRNA dimethylallyltransferase
MRGFEMKKPIIVIVGPTASGKTGVAIELAEKIGGEIICADSRTIYKSMDIGTAKPGVPEQKNVVHYGLDLVEPNERFTVYDWKKYAEQKIYEIRRLGKYPIIVGGTGLYIDALIYNYQFDQKHKSDQIDRNKMGDDFLVYGVKWTSEELRERIRLREQQMFDNEGLIAETKELVKKFDWNTQSMRSNIYQFVWRMLNKEITKEEAIRLGALDDYHLAKRQMTWFKRNHQIKWLRLKDLNEEIIKDIKLFE